MRNFSNALIAVLALALAGCSGSSKPADTASGGEAPNAEAAKLPAFKNIVVTDDENTRTPKSTFTKNTPEIIVAFDLENMPSGSKIRGVWICEQSKVSEPNYKIDEATLEIGPLVNVGKFTLTKPTAGWPAGSYRTELYFGNQLLETVKFTVAE